MKHPSILKTVSAQAKRAVFIYSLLSCTGLSAFADNVETLGGFAYGDATAPEGNEWNNPEALALNKEQPTATFYPFQDTESARMVLPENSKYWICLNGSWKFKWSPTPDERPKGFQDPNYNVSLWDNIDVPSSWNIAGMQKDGSQKYGTPIYVNQPVIFMHKVEVDDWRGGVMRTPPENWTTYRMRNEVGSYRRTFDMPSDWLKRRTVISFDGVDSFFYLWINGKYVGFSKNSRNAARFDISKYLHEGQNTVAVEVYRNSDGSFLEAQDMFRLPGIFRTVALYSTPRIHIRDLRAIPALNGTDGELHISAEVRNLDKSEAKNFKMKYTLYENGLYSDNNKETDGGKAESEAFSTKAGTTITTSTSLKLKSAKLWSAENPQRYTLVAQLVDNKGRIIETTSIYTGFRTVEIKDTPAEKDEFGLAGRYFYINGKTVKLKGVNRHETNPALGHAITRKQMENEVMMMKRANINHVRNSHYPCDPYWYYLCDKYGIYLEDEANIESHEYYYGKESLSHPKEWTNAHVARNMEMVHSTVNSPSIVIWSLGNEAGPGDNFKAAYKAIKAFDTSRPVQYERNNDIVDMGSNQYPSIAWMREAVKGKSNIKYPFHVSEYAHSMGNAVGNLVDYWDAIESTNYFCGGAIWDWIDQAMYNYDKATGKRYLAYGGDFGDTPNSGQFVMNGIIFADMTPKPQYYEVKKVYEYIDIKAVDIQNGDIEIFNKNYFTTLENYILEWSIWKDGICAENGTIKTLDVEPREKSIVRIPYTKDNLDSESEYSMIVQIKQAKDTPWAKAGYVQAEEQMFIKDASEMKATAKTSDMEKMEVKDAGNELVSINGTNFDVSFNNATGTIQCLVYNGDTIIAEGKGPRLEPYRAFVNNDNWICDKWFELGLHNLKHKVTNKDIHQEKDGRLILTYTVESQAPNSARLIGGTSSGHNEIKELEEKKFGENDFKFTSNQVWTVYSDGRIEFNASVSSSNPDVILPRLGWVTNVPKRLKSFTYYGRGPIENYPDRKTGQFIRVYESSTDSQFVNFPKPQNMANHEEVRWAALTDKRGAGAVFIGKQPMSVTALTYSEVDLTVASHGYQLPEAGDTYLHLDVGVTGLGGNSCGQGGPLEQDRIKADGHRFGFMIAPSCGNPINASKTVFEGPSPLSIERDENGQIVIGDEENNGEILYTTSEISRAKVYSSPIVIESVSTVTAWNKKNPNVRSTIRIPEADKAQLKVIYASSQENGGGQAENLVDGKNETLWETIHSVTVAKYPHWVDFDAGRDVNINGFKIVPREKGKDGFINEFCIYVSKDGKNWGNPIVQGKLENSNKPSILKTNKTVSARYIRFKAMSSHEGNDLATLAEFGIIEN